MADSERGAAFLDGERENKPRLMRPAEYLDDVADLYHKGLRKGDSTGWPSLDEHFTVASGQMTIVTGWPGSGKSEFVDALLVNLSKAGWRAAIYSPENYPPKLHISKLIEKMIGKPFGVGPTERMTQSELSAMLPELHRKFRFITAPSGSSSVKDILDAAMPVVEQGDERCALVIDPYNELEHWRPHNMTETEYVSKILSTVRNWARTNSVHVFIVAHPQKMRTKEGTLPVPRPDMISGSQNFWNKADNCLTVFRDFLAGGQGVDIYVQKIRFKHLGQIGKVSLKYDKVTGRYFEFGPRSVTLTQEEPGTDG